MVTEYAALYKSIIVRLFVYVALTRGQILVGISNKLGMMDGCRMGIVTVNE